jgi:predicted transposase YbfD/YdcC
LFLEKGVVVEKFYGALPVGARLSRRLAGWGRHLSTVVRVLRTRELASGPETDEQFYACSAEITAEQAKRAIESHWQVENQFHQRLDRALGEDAKRSCSGAMTWSLMAMAAHNVLRKNMALGKARGWKEMMLVNAMRPKELFAMKGIA